MRGNVKTGDSDLANYIDLQDDNTYHFVEKGGKNGQIRAYKSANGKLIKANYDGAAKTITYFFKDIFKQIFLPVGYPDSVSDDYISYQIWDTIQAFCSTITGTFTTQSILKSVGVGDNTATALGAAITWIIKDGSGMGGRILFAWWQGDSLDANCKSWRLFADILNDMALAIEFTLPCWQLQTNMYVLCMTSTMKSIVGVAGGATRAAITQHQAVHGNMGDVSAKDGSQETCVNLLASICGIFLLTYFENNEIYLGLIFFLLTLMHIYANFKAIRSLVFKNLNLTRLLIVFNSYLQYDAVANPIAVNKLEPVFTRKQNPSTLCGFDIKMGISMRKALSIINVQEFDVLKEAFQGHNYIILPCFKNRTLYVGLAQKIDSEVILKAYFHAIMLGIALSQHNNLILNVKTKRQLHHVIPLQRLNNLMKRFPKNLQTPSLEMFTIDKFTEFNEFIKVEVMSFFTALSINEWQLTRNSLQVGEWRCNLKFSDESSKKRD